MLRAATSTAGPRSTPITSRAPYWATSRRYRPLPHPASSTIRPTKDAGSTGAIQPWAKSHPTSVPPRQRGHDVLDRRSTPPRCAGHGLPRTCAVAGTGRAAGGLTLCPRGQRLGSGTARTAAANHPPVAARPRECSRVGTDRAALAGAPDRLRLRARGPGFSVAYRTRATSSISFRSRSEKCIPSPSTSFWRRSRTTCPGRRWNVASQKAGSRLQRFAGTTPIAGAHRHGRAAKGTSRLALRAPPRGELDKLPSPRDTRPGGRQTERPTHLDVIFFKGKKH